MLNKTQLIPKICFAAHVAHEIVALNFLFSAAMKTKTTAKATRTTTTIASTASNLRVAGRESIYVCMTEDYGYVSETVFDKLQWIGKSNRQKSQRCWIFIPFTRNDSQSDVLHVKSCKGFYFPVCVGYSIVNELHVCSFCYCFYKWNYWNVFFYPAIN